MSNLKVGDRARLVNLVHTGEDARKTHPVGTIVIIKAVEYIKVLGERMHIVKNENGKGTTFLVQPKDIEPLNE